MPARRNDDEPASLDDIAGRVLIGVTVGDEAAAPLRVAVMIGRGRLDEGVGQHPLEGVTRDVARGERTLKRVCMLTGDGLDPRGGKRRPIMSSTRLPS